MKLFKKIGLGLLSLAGLVGLASCGNTNKETVPTLNTKMNMSSVQTLTVTDEQINEYIKGKNNPGNTHSNSNLYYFYDVFVNRTGIWELSTEGEVFYEDDEAGEVYGFDADLPLTLTFDKGKAYIFDAMIYNWRTGASSSEISSTLKSIDKSYQLFEIYGSSVLALKSKCEFICDYGSDLDIYYTNDDGYAWPDSDMNICEEINNRYVTKLNQIYAGSTYNFKSSGSPIIIIPNETFTLNMVENGYKSYPGAKMEIRSASISELNAVIDTTAPSIVGENIYINVDNPLTFEQIKSRFTATDETDGDITSRLSFTDNTYILTNGKINCGTYSFKVSVSDNAGNTTTKLYYAHVVDYTDPTITGKTINVSYKKLLTEAEKKALFTYSDNYTPTNNIIFKWVEDNYTSTYQELGAHTLTAKVLDQQGNEASATSTINVIDDVAPFMVIPENLKITTLDDLTLDSFRQYVTVTDEKEGNITDFELTDLDDYLNHKKVAGTYRIKVVASDSPGNSIEKIFSFLNEDKDMPSIKIDPDYIMIVNQGDIITKEQVINYFIATGQLTLEESYGVEVASVYFEQPVAAAGFYSLRLMTEGKLIESKIEVVGDGTSDDPTDPKNPIKPAENKFLSTEGYAENFFKPASWSIYHYLTIVGIVLVIGIGIFVWVKKKD